MSIDPSQVTAIIRTRGTRDLSRILPTLPYGEIIVSVDDDGLGIFGRYQDALEKAKHDVIYWQDDDVVFTEHEKLCEVFTPDRLHAQMRPEWIEGCGYFDMALQGEGALCHRDLIEPVFARYLAVYPGDEFFRRHADFIFGTLVRFSRYNFGVEILDSASDDEALWKQDDQLAGKAAARKRARGLRKVVLTMLAKNEATNIRRAIISAAPWIDAVLVHDTGSTDHTRDVVNATCLDWNLDCHIEMTPFANFGANRAQLMTRAYELGYDYQLLMDADEELIGLPPERPDLVSNMTFEYEGEFAYRQPRLLQCKREWYWQDEVHSYLLTDDPFTLYEHLDAPRIRHHGAARGATRERVLRDVAKLAEQVKAGTADSRTVFNLAKALDGLGEYEHAKTLFRLRLEMGGWDEELFFSRFRLGTLTCLSNFNEGAELLLEAWRERPWRIEPLRDLAAHATSVASQAPYPKGEVLFVRRSDYPQGG